MKRLILGALIGISISAAFARPNASPQLRLYRLNGQPYYDIPEVPSINDYNFTSLLCSGGSVEMQQCLAIKELAYRVFCLEQKAGINQPCIQGEH